MGIMNAMAHKMKPSKKDREVKPHAHREPCEFQKKKPAWNQANPTPAARRVQQAREEAAKAQRQRVILKR